jgi:hypothetical protein
VVDIAVSLTDTFGKVYNRQSARWRQPCLPQGDENDRRGNQRRKAALEVRRLAQHQRGCGGSLAGGREGAEFTLPRISKAEVVGYFEGLAKDWSMVFYRVDEYVAQGPRVVALGECSWTNRNTGKTITIPKVDVWKFKNGKAVQFMEYYDTQKLLEASRP